MPRILIIVPDPGDLITLKTNLETRFETAEVITASSGEEGIEKAGDKKPETILFDIRMPDMDGYEACRRIKSEPGISHIPLIMLKAPETEPENRVPGGGNEPDLYLLKPINEQMLTAQVRAALRIKRSEETLHNEREKFKKLASRRTWQLKKQQEFLREILDGSPGFIYVKDTSCRIVLVNKRFTENFGLPEESVLGRTMVEVMPEQPALAQKMHENDRLVLIGTMNKIECEEQYPDQYGAIRWALSVKFPLHGDNGRIRGLIGISTDITDQKIKARQQQKLESQLRQAQKMEAIGTLAGGIAHDFNNILSSIIGYTELSLEEVEKESFLEKNLNQILHGGMRARELVKQILTFSRQAEQEKMPVQLKLLLKEAIKFLRASMPATIEIKEDIRSDVLVFGDAGQFHQVIMNLCTNAFHAMSEKGGIMQVSLSRERIENNFKYFHPEIKPGDYVKLSVSDTGQGMSEDIIDKVFDPFFTTKPDGQGTGLGLSVVHGIVHSHGGTINVSSQPGRGTLFTVYLPVADPAEEEKAEVDDPAPTGSETVLFVNDEITLTNLAQRVLKSLGYRVVTRNSSGEALTLFLENPDKFDLVITDLTMPELTGDQLTEKIKEIRPDIPIIMCTGFSERFNEDHARNLGISAFIMKPLVRTDLAKAIRNVLDRK